VSGSRNWVGGLLLRAPASLRSIRKVPVLGEFVHRISHRLLGKDERVWVQIRSGHSKGLWIELNARTGQDYLRGDAESHVQEVLAGRLRPGMVFCDLGANVGLFSLLAARIVGSSGRVFSFEPDPEVAGRLTRNVDRNGFRNVTVVKQGVWSSSCLREFIPADDSSPDHGTGTFLGSTQQRPGISVECVCLDDFAKNAPLPDGIKCDVEGAEVEVLRGATSLLAERRPWVLCETHSEANDRACRELLKRFDYRFDAVDANHFFASPKGA
jgi:FkbM family methyltransferase